nr:ATP-binding protein [Desulforadius tongensis]
MADALIEKEKLEEEIRKQERLAALGRIVTGVAHELRNPIGVIKATVQLMEAEKKDPSIQEYCQVIKQQVDRQNKVIHELLSYGKPSKPVKEMVQINKLLDSVLTFFIAAQLRQSNIELVTNFSPELPPVYADGERIKQVFVNIILNAIEVMPGGGKLDITTRHDANNVIISFKDTGTGIDKEKIKNIFDPFFTTKETGTGLGLTICNQIISMHNGVITAECNEDGGMTFTVKLPLNQEMGRDDR